MIEGLIQIGSALSSGGNSLSNFVVNVKPRRGKRQLNVLKINFDLENEKLEMDVFEEMDEDSSEKYNFIGKFGGPNSPQWYVTSNHINFHISETIYNLSQQDLGNELNDKVNRILEVFYYEFEEELPSKYRYSLNIEKANITNMSMKEIYEEVSDEKKKVSDIGKEIITQISKEISAYLRDNYDMTLDDFGLFTILIDGEAIAQKDEYIAKAIESKEPKASDKRMDTGVCSICQSKENLAEKIDLKIKFYTMNQIIFASGLDKKGYFKNMQMCGSCMSKYLAGENYIQNRLRTKLAKFDVYIIPQFIYGEPLDENDLNMATEKIINSFNIATSLEGIEGMKRDIENVLEIDSRDGYFLLNFLFYKSSQQATKVQALIKDVNPSIFENISSSSYKVYKDMVGILGDGLRENINLLTVYYMNPVKLVRGTPTQFRSVLQTYDAILTGKKIRKIKVIENIVDCIKIIRLDQEGFNIEPQKNRLEFYTIRANMYLKFLEYLGTIEGRRNSMDGVLNVKEEFNEFIERMGYDEQQTAMFLLGTLIGEIGNVQYGRSEDGNKPILNKLNFNGIDKSKLVRLVKDVFNKLNQENIRKYNEITFFEMKKLLDKNLDGWKLNKDENLFYILSGYSFVTVKSILYKGDKDVK